MESTNTKKLVDELIEDNQLNKDVVKTLKPKDNLCEKIFDNSQKMHENIRQRLIKISDIFIDFVDIDFFIHDIVLTGSLANYNWSKYSDIDLHILIDMNEFTFNDSKTEESIKNIIQKFFMSKKNLWNNNHSINIKNFDVEIYVEDINEKHVSSGVYSILNNDWIIKPQKRKESIDEQLILDKANEYIEMIDDLINSKENTEDILKKIKEIKNKIKKFRKSGLEKGGEYSYENLTFKLLRRNGYINKLIKLKKDLLDKKLSI